MNIQDLIKMANRFGIGQDKINQALSLSNKYSNDINGLRRVINDNGGKEFLDKALEFANKPLVQAGLKKFGVTPELINGIKKDLGIAETDSLSNGNNDIMERLKRLK